MTENFDLGRFVAAQEGVHETALRELSSGQKRSHWMWYVFPQIGGLVRLPSRKARLYALSAYDNIRRNFTSKAGGNNRAGTLEHNTNVKH